MEIRHHSKEINREAHEHLRQFKLKKNLESFLQWLNCMLYAPAMRTACKTFTKHYDTKINQRRRRRKPSDFCDPKQNFCNKTIKRLGWDK